MLIAGAVRRYEKSFALHRAHTEDRINLLSSRLNDLSLVVSDTNQASHGIVNLVLSLPETIIQTFQSLLALPGLVLKHILMILVKGRSGIKGVNGIKGKVSKMGSKAPANKRVASKRAD